MNIYKFIESKDIREHCRKLGHRFNTVESAYLVWQNRFTSLAEKHAAWREIIGTMPDMQWSHKGKDWGSIHNCIERYMELEDRLVEDFCETDEMYPCDEYDSSDTEIAGRYMGIGTVFPQIFQGGQQQILYAQLWRPPTAPVLFRISFSQNFYQLFKCCPLYPGNSPKSCV